MTRALYPGSFDPIHNGHIDIVQRAAALFDEVVVAVYDTPSKRLLFTTEERQELTRLSLAHLPNVRVVAYRGLTVQAARDFSTPVIVRGLRATSDYEYEAQLAQTNKALAPEIEAVCLFTSLKHAYLSSSILKEVAALHGDYVAWVSEPVYHALQAKYAS